MHDSNELPTASPIMEQVCSAIRAGRLDEAMGLLATSQAQQPHDGYAWNLLGVVRECQNTMKEARRAYRKAIAADEKLNAPRQNMRRLYEWQTFGRTDEPLSLGDHEILLRRSLESSLTRKASVSTPF